MPNPQDWKIKSRSHACAHTGEPFADEQPLYAALFHGGDSPDTDFVRKDYSLPSWQAVRGQLQPFSFWKTVYKAPPPPDQKPEVVEKESAESLLRRLIEEDDPKTENARFILAVMLERKKTLRQTDTQSTGQHKLLIYEHHKSGEVFIVADPDLKLAEVERVQQEVSALLGGPADRDAKGTPTGDDSTPTPQAPATSGQQDNAPKA